VSKRKKIVLFSCGVLIVAAAVAFAIHWRNRNVTTVQTSRASRQGLTATVSASGEIRPDVYVNIGANAFGKIVKLYVEEGERVKQGQLLAQIENVQSNADVAATRAQLEASRTDSVAAAAALKTSQANLDRARAEAERARLDYERAEKMFGEKLIAKSDFDSTRAAWETASAAVDQAKAQVAQAQAQKQSADAHINQVQATLTRATDVFAKTIYAAPFNGVITNLPVREGETVVVGIQNSPGSTLMTLANMSVINAEVNVDETDIVNVEVGQLAEVTIDALPNQVFAGTVTQIGDNALLRSTGISTTQSSTSTQEAKDFKVVVKLSKPPDNLRPGLSATAKITTAHRENALTIPIQALTVRQRSALAPRSGEGTVEAAEHSTDSKRDREELQGVFVIRDNRAQFVQVKTGIAGTTDIEVLSGLQPGDQVVTGSYQALRTLVNDAKVKVDNSPPKEGT
jgi:HlyD family secretion protein